MTSSTESQRTSAANTRALERVLRHDRLILVTALTAITGIAWIWVVIGAGTGMSTIGMTRRSGMPDVSGMIMEPAVWTPVYAGLMFAMWWVMMVAMMLPSATTMLLLFARINRKERAQDRPYVPTGIFAAGYLVAWGGFSIAATALQWLFERLGLLSPMMVATSYWLGGAILVLAGLVQGWRPGSLGAFRMGIEHGAYCLGCCWFLMGLLFFGGIMNLFWIAGLAVYVLLEKTIPFGHWLGRAVGIAAVAGGVLMFASAAGTY
jgi:predicted metal-binding membrane protein